MLNNRPNKNIGKEIQKLSAEKYKVTTHKNQSDFSRKRILNYVHIALAVLGYTTQFKILSQFFTIFVFLINDTDTAGGNPICKQVFNLQGGFTHFLPLGVILAYYRQMCQC